MSVTYRPDKPNETEELKKEVETVKAAGVLIGKRLGRKEYDAAYGDAKKIMVTGLVGAK